MTYEWLSRMEEGKPPKSKEEAEFRLENEMEAMLE
jgi:hypothetical protein